MVWFGVCARARGTTVGVCVCDVFMGVTDVPVVREAHQRSVCVCVCGCLYWTLRDGVQMRKQQKMLHEVAAVHVVIRF